MLNFAAYTSTVLLSVFGDARAGDTCCRDRASYVEMLLLLRTVYLLHASPRSRIYLVAYEDGSESILWAMVAYFRLSGQ